MLGFIINGLIGATSALAATGVIIFGIKLINIIEKNSLFQPIFDYKYMSNKY